MHYIDGFQHPYAQSYDLVRAVYGASDGFAADLDELYPDLNAFSSSIDGLSSQAGALFVLVMDGQELGAYLLLKPRPWRRLSHTADLNMGVAPVMQGRGVGRGLLRHTLALATCERHLEIIYLMVRADNQAALRLYESAGFTRQALLHHDTRVADDYFDGILMSKMLLPDGDHFP